MIELFIALVAGLISFLSPFTSNIPIIGNYIAEYIFVGIIITGFLGSIVLFAPLATIVFSLFQEKIIKEIEIKLIEKEISLPKILKEAEMVSSTSEALRLIKQGAVRIEGKKILDSKYKINRNSSLLYQVGKRKFFRIKIP